MLEPFFLETADGELFIQQFLPNAGEQHRKGILIIPPLFEELNRSRAILARQSRALADRGFEVVLPDLTGTGDSFGELADATVAVWGKNIEAVADWMENRGLSLTGFIAVRAGSLLLDSLLNRFSIAVLWSPIAKGSLVTNALVRLRLAGEMTSSADSKAVRDDFLNEMRDCGSVEIAGYEITEALYKSISNATFDLQNTNRTEVYCIDVRSDGNAEASRAIRNIAATSQGSAHTVVVEGSQFWNVVELVDVPELEEATTRVFTTTA